MSNPSPRRAGSSDEPGGLWRLETSAIFGADPIEIICSATELDSPSAMPLQPMWLRRAEHEGYINAAERSVRTAEQAFLELATENAALSVGPPHPRFWERLARLAQELAQARNHLQQLQSGTVDIFSANVVGKYIESWIEDLRLTNVVRIFGSPDLTSDPTAGGDALISYYLDQVENSKAFTREQVKAIRTNLANFPVPVFGSKPETLQSLHTLLGSGSFIGVVAYAHESNGPVLACITAGAAFLIWFSKPSVSVVRQAAKNWIAGRLGVKEIESD